MPAGNGDGNIDSFEFVAVPVAAIRDNNQDGVFDILDPRRGFVPRVIATGSGFSLSWPAIPARRYRVQYTDDLSQPFVNLSGELIAAQGQYSMTYNDPTAAAAVRRFYRVHLLNP